MPKKVGLHVQTVRSRIQAFNNADSDRKERWKLFNVKPKTGRKPEFDELVSHQLVEFLHQPPTNYGIESCRWTLHALGMVAQRKGLVKTINHESVRRLLSGKGYSSTCKPSFG